MTKVFIEAFDDGISLLAVILAVKSLVDSISDTNDFIRNHSTPIIIILCIFFFFIVIYRSIKRNIYLIQYRIRELPMSLDLSVNLLGNGETIEITTKKEFDKSILLKFFESIDFGTFIKWQYPIGTIVEMERDYEDFELVSSEDKSQSKVAQEPLSASGRRKIRLYAYLNSKSTFDGEDYLDIKLFIAPKNKHLRYIIKFELCSQKIKILPKV